MPAFFIGNSFTTDVLGDLSFLDEAAEIGSKVARHLSDIDAADMAKAGRGLSHMDELAGVTKAGRSADELAEIAAVGMGRYADEAMDVATTNRLRNLDGFTGGSTTTRSADEVRASIHAQSDQAALTRRLNGGDCTNSFTAGTLIETDEGQKPIEEIQVGDKVLAEDPNPGEQVTSRSLPSPPTPRAKSWR